MNIEKSRNAYRGILEEDHGQVEVLEHVHTDRYVKLAFWTLGLINNTGYVIMAAGAKEIHSGGVGLVYLCDILPGFLLKASAPHWFHVVPYPIRCCICAVLQSCSFLLVGLSSTLVPQLIGVMLQSLQSALGEASFLSLASKYGDKTHGSGGRAALTMWSSGTGAAGLVGYAWVYTFLYIFKSSLRGTMLCANLLPLALLLTFFGLLQPPSQNNKTQDKEICEPLTPSGTIQNIRTNMRVSGSNTGFVRLDSDILQEDGLQIETSAVDVLTMRERLKFAAGLWPHMLPLTVVYAAEYTSMTGAWSAIGFPTDSEAARRKFYIYANWAYQLGVFLSRSSGLLIHPPALAIRLGAPATQVGLTIFFYAAATRHIWYNWGLLFPCFFSGLLGGAVYVFTFTRLAASGPPRMRELSMACVSIADSIGIIAADIGGLFMQACVYEANNIPGAAVQCI